jgi:hypothetical protein
LGSNALLQPESRPVYQRVLAQGWTDSVRKLHPKEPMYTFWDYKRERWERDDGLRLEHILLSSVLRDRLQSGGVDRQTRGMEGASDHAPVWVVLRNEPDYRRAPLRQAIGQTIALFPTASPKRPRPTNRTGDGTGARRRAASADNSARSDHPLLAIDGDSFGHR